MNKNAAEERFDIAIIGMSGRFPGARNLKEFWNNLQQGVESIRTFSDEELVRRGVDPESIHAPSYVKAGSVLHDADRFAASFFGYSPREAELMDPQHRLFLECSWEAIEDAGYAPRHLKGVTGVYAGVSLSSYMLFNLIGNPAVDPLDESFDVMVGGDKDFLCTRLSYKLNLKGPSVAVQTGCSTSLVALHLALQSLLTCQCDVAITGGVSVGVPQRTGYYYQAGGIASPDGHCRPFDAGAQGTIFGEGIGVLVLKRLEDAIQDGDHVYAVIRGSAVNNDGSAKVGYTAPSIEGQAEVIAMAQAVAGLSADMISYVEAHGTATGLGDPAEVAGLTQAFRRTTTKAGFCGLGAVKSNIGHLDAAAGVAGLIKTALMLHHKRLVPSLHFQAPNPKIDFADSPFFVVSRTQEWKSESTRRAGVSSFGIGGTNVHVILEEAPAPLRDLTRKSMQILSLSAQTETALEVAVDDLLHFLEANPDELLPDVAYTLHTGRESFAQRRSILCYDSRDAVEALKLRDQERVFAGTARPGLRVAFMFPGGGTQYPGMGNDLYKTEPEFRRQIELCCSLLKDQLGYDLRTLLYPADQEMERAAAQLMRPSAGLPAIFSTEYALARLLMSWGIHPECMLGHSLGEYAAACLGGVFSLEAALSLVTFRGRLFEKLPGGSMLSVYLSEEQVRPFLNESLSIAAVNSPTQCVISGPSDEIGNLCTRLSEREIEFHRLHIDAAAHSAMVEPVMAEFRRFLQGMQLNASAIPFISNLTGTWIAGAQASDPEYWVQHLRHTVRFAEGLAVLTSKDNVLALEVGPSRTLSSLAAPQCKEKTSWMYSCLPHPQDSTPELSAVYKTLARAWNAGVEVDWPAFYAQQKRSRVPLPTYPFERERYWISPGEPTTSMNLGRRKENGVARVYTPSWRGSPALVDAAPADSGSLWVLLLDDFGVGEALIRSLAEQGQRVIGVRAANCWSCDGNGSYTVGINSEADFHRLFEELPQFTADPINVVHLWGLRKDEPISCPDTIREVRRRTCFSFLTICKALSRISRRNVVRFCAVSNGMFQVTGLDRVSPEKASFASACWVAPQELEHLSCRVIDVDLEDPRSQVAGRIARQLMAEIRSTSCDRVVAYRGLRRWLPAYQLQSRRFAQDQQEFLRENGVYLITGGTGAIGPVIANSFASRQRCRLVLTGRSFPDPSDWSRWLDSHPNDDRVSQSIRIFQEIEAKGSSLAFFKADISNDVDMKRVFGEIRERFGSIHGVVHLAGITGSDALQLIPDLSELECERQFAPKIGGCYVLSRLLEGVDLDFCLLFSSTASILGGAGMTAYAAANGFLDGFAIARSLESGQKWFSVNWDAWMTPSTPGFIGSGKSALDRFSLSSDEAVCVLHEILAQEPGQYIVSKADLQFRIKEAMDLSPGARPAAVQDSEKIHSRPALTSDYAVPATQLQRDIAAVWGEVLGIDRIGLYDNLFELGGNSLIGLRIISKLKRSLSIDIPVTALFEGPTVLALSQIVGAVGQENDYSGSRRRGERRRQKRVAGVSLEA